MEISLIIPTLNGEKFLSLLLTSLKRQTHPPVEIIVMDSSSGDRTAEIAAEMGCKTVVIEREAFDHGGTRNLGAEIAAGDVLVFMTQDALPADDRFLENLVKPLANQTNPLIAASFGRQLARQDAVPPEKFARLFNYPGTGMVKSKEDLPRLGIKAFFFSDVCSAVRKREFEEVGRFPEKVIMNEDMILAAKLILRGYKVAYVPEAAVRHSHNYSLSQHFRRYFDIGVSLKMNNWLLEYTKAEGEGFRFVRDQFVYLIK
ncbi:glycosyltransferase, partial [Pelotomaculum sp. PtaB.Bin117]|uniref:glycosyltransferase family 2 protein n=1 Tax=Pelotomaculum sp. PtaB.Bin117 TaxID=1811694 RepID=UPI00257EA64F